MLKELLNERKRSIATKLEQRLKSLAQTQDWRDPEGVLSYVGIDVDEFDQVPTQLMKHAKDVSNMLRDERFTEDQVDNYVDIFYRWKKDLFAQQGRTQ